MNRSIILANGQHPEKDVFTYLQSKGFDKLVCADGGANSAFQLDLIPDYIIGDLDSIHSSVREYYKGKSKIIQISRQDDTDVEKSLKFLIQNNCKEVVLLGATGDRLDHTFCNLGITLKFFDQIKIYILHQKSLLEVREGKSELQTTPGEVISLYGFDGNTLIKTDGLKYPLEYEPLPFGVRESTSNEALGDEIKISVSGGRIFIIRNFSEIIKNDFFSHC